MTKYLTAAQLADRLQLFKPTVYRLARAGTIPCVRVGRSIRFDADEVELWLRRHRQDDDDTPATASVDADH